MIYRVAILLTVFIFVASSYTFATPNKSYLHANKTPRSLQESLSRQLEERGFLTNVVTNVKMWWKARRWAKKGTPENEVKKALGLDKMTESSIKAHPNYKYYQKFLYKAEGIKLDGWVESSKISPPTVWRHFGLDKMSASQRETSDNMRVYVRYLKKYDDAVYRYGYKEYFPSSEAEKQVYLKVWAMTDRPDQYVLKRLNIDRGENKYFSYNYKRMRTRWKTEEEIMAHPNYYLFREFQRLKAQSW
ncbi:hypothetical protein AM587_10009123 [Phytophthora nicotianae]|uniref:RxLR effector protein n=2 Tax=Phytophthora nicotianae TaxID=4792 RepID=A0A0W8DNI7_PHYNI|nr:hypothetical protein AM587_10009123 [Phytophthora nicotianae]